MNDIDYLRRQQDLGNAMMRKQMDAMNRAGPSMYYGSQNNITAQAMNAREYTQNVVLPKLLNRKLLLCSC
jgi:hypothetical protein